jgi:acyl-CoA synthetase (AMP-forming)/AMP-acid ligase II
VELLVGDVFRNAARTVPNRLAVAAGPHRLTFRELDDQANRIARALTALGLGVTDRVVTWADSTIDLVPVFAGAAKAGTVFAPLNGRLGVGEARPTLQMARPALLIVDAERAPDAPGLAAELGVDWFVADTVTGAAPAGTPSLAAVIDGESADDPGRPAALTEADPHVIFFTSGSTGRPKGVILSNRVSVLRSHPGSQIEPRGALVCPFPLFHMGAWTLAMQQWHARDAIALTGADGPAICAAVDEHRATRVYLIPAVARRVLDHLASPAGAGHDTSSVRFADSGTSATPPALLREMAAAYPNATLRVFYGSTESGNVAALEHRDMEAKPGSCGVPSPLCEVRQSPEGELQVRSAVMFDGYFENPEATAAAFEDGWFRTGDRVELDADGYLTITGRVHDIIRSGGEAVVPVEVEQVLASHPDIADVAIIGLPDPVWGEVVCAAVVPVAGREITLDMLRAHCAGLARHKHPRQLLLVDAIPRTPATMQVQRRLLVEQASSAQRVD